MSTMAGTIRALEACGAGTDHHAGDVEYDEARRVWNGMIDKRPLAIVQAASAADVAPVIRVARERGLPLAIRGGGHNVAGNGSVDGGIVLDLGGLRDVDVDPVERLVRVGAGATLGDIDRATEPFGLAVPIGVVSGTGIAGLTLGGGVGWLTRAYGLTIDNLVAADVVLATGEHVVASESERADLFWGLRGGGGNFGVVTSFTFRAQVLDPDVLAGTLIYERHRWPEALRAYRDWAADLPDEITTLVTFMVPPPDWELGDQVLMLLGFAWAGADRGAGEAVARPAPGRLPAGHRRPRSDALDHVPVRVRREHAEGRPGVLAQRVVRAPRRRDDRRPGRAGRRAVVVRDGGGLASHGRRLRARAGGRDGVSRAERPSSG